MGLLLLLLPWTAQAESIDDPGAEDPAAGHRPPVLKYEAPAETARDAVLEYTVQAGDTIYDIASRYHISVDTLMWANDLEGHADRLSIGATLTVLPVDGVLHTVEPGDTLHAIAHRYKASEDAIRNLPGNGLAGESPLLQAGQKLIVPGGVKVRPAPAPAPTPQPAAAPEPASAGEPAPVSEPEAAPAPPERAAPAATDAAAAASAPTAPLAATNQFAWPINGTVSQGYRRNHRAVDILGTPGMPIHASDNGTVIYTGWTDDGYGYHVIIDHGNGYRSLYAHMASIDVSVGQVVHQGDVIGGVGDTGRASAFHVHFEIEQGDVRLNPADFLH